MYFLKEEYGDPYVYINSYIDYRVYVHNKWYGDDYRGSELELEVEDLDEDEFEALVNRTLKKFWDYITEGLMESGLVLRTEYNEAEWDWGPLFFCAHGDENKLADYIKEYFNCDLKVFDWDDEDDIHFETYDSFGYTTVSVEVSCRKFNGVIIDRD